MTDLYLKHKTETIKINQTWLHLILICSIKYSSSGIVSALYSSTDERFCCFPSSSFPFQLLASPFLCPYLSVVVKNRLDGLGFELWWGWWGEIFWTHLDWP